MAIPSRQIGQPSSTKAQLLWNISKQLENLIKLAGNVVITPPAPVSTTWTFTTGDVSIFPADSTGYTVYSGAWTAFDDGQTVDTFPLAGDFFYNNDGGRNTMYLSTNGNALASDSSYAIYGNGGDLFLTPTDPLSDGTVQNFFYQNIVDSTKWKTSVLVYYGHCCGSPQQQTPYSYILNIYRDNQYQYIETCSKTNLADNSGPDNATESPNTLTQVWQSDLPGSTWT